jgi:hypothetical protein
MTATIAAAALVLGTPPHKIVADVPQPATLKAYEAYFEQARRAFIARASVDTGTPPRSGIRVAPGQGDGITEVPGGLIHHWAGGTFVPGVTLKRAVDASQDYATYSTVYKAIQASKLLVRDGNIFTVWMRVKGGGGGLTVVLEARSTVEYFQPAPHRVYSIANVDEIREVKDPGSRDERLLERGDDRGYLWRANTMTLLTARDGGIVVDMETFGLSRRFPPLLGWIIEPVARRLGRRSVEQSLQEFAASLTRDRPVATSND